jgi:hypothetical protein
LLQFLLVLRQATALMHYTALESNLLGDPSLDLGFAND